ncbi:unnamed protein product [Paramecium pentaurelia]|uniref:Tetratricopeptide repeat protein n=1 Tax=Paramecium pentaurelia TaxID=43138 RepID=A0A8S1T009_9CILI|nr:unnamed protein product [Paramecium pentaurelia]
MKLRQTINLILIIKFILKQNKQLRRVKIKIQKLKENKEGSALSTHSYFSNNLSKLKKYQEAIKCYEKAISINPKESAWSNKDKLINNSGATLHKLKNYKDAVQCQDQALSIYTKSIRLKRKGTPLLIQFQYS